MVIIPILFQAEFGPNDHREDAFHFTFYHQHNDVTNITVNNIRPYGRHPISEPFKKLRFLPEYAVILPNA